MGFELAHHHESPTAARLELLPSNHRACAQPGADWSSARDGGGADVPSAHGISLGLGKARVDQSDPKTSLGARSLLLGSNR